jgi:hypothetical protein
MTDKEKKEMMDAEIRMVVHYLLAKEFSPNDAIVKDAIDRIKKKYVKVSPHNSIYCQ